VRVVAYDSGQPVHVMAVWVGFMFLASAEITDYVEQVVWFDSQGFGHLLRFFSPKFSEVSFRKIYKRF